MSRSLRGGSNRPTLSRDRGGAPGRGIVRASWGACAPPAARQTPGTAWARSRHAIHQCLGQEKHGGTRKECGGQLPPLLTLKLWNEIGGGDIDRHARREGQAVLHEKPEFLGEHH